jgi:AcrR family transcriptional regulator
MDEPSVERIVEETLALASEVGWEGVRLRMVAERLGVPLTAILQRFRDLDGVADAYFRRGWEAMLQPPPVGFAEMTAGERTALVLMRWFEALAPHRSLAAHMIAAKLYPSHPHHWVPAIFNLSRTIHWLRDAAMLDARGLRRQGEEIYLTALFVAALAVWVRDDTPSLERTRGFVLRRLSRWR